MVRGNLALLNSTSTGKAIRLFQTTGRDATYVGEFALADLPFVEQVIPDESGAMRRGYVFPLEPVRARTELLQASEWTPPSSIPW